MNKVTNKQLIRELAKTKKKLAELTKTHQELVAINLREMAAFRDLEATIENSNKNFDEAIAEERQKTENAIYEGARLRFVIGRLLDDIAPSTVPILKKYAPIRPTGEAKKWVVTAQNKTDHAFALAK